MNIAETGLFLRRLGSEDMVDALESVCDMADSHIENTDLSDEEYPNDGPTVRMHVQMVREMGAAVRASGPMRDSCIVCNRQAWDHSPTKEGHQYVSPTFPASNAGTRTPAEQLIYDVQTLEEFPSMIQSPWGKKTLREAAATLTLWKNRHLIEPPEETANRVGGVVFFDDRQAGKNPSGSGGGAQGCRHAHPHPGDESCLATGNSIGGA